jgi:hypothetical protein
LAQTRQQSVPLADVVEDTVVGCPELATYTTPSTRIVGEIKNKRTTRRLLLNELEYNSEAMPQHIIIFYVIFSPCI